MDRQQLGMKTTTVPQRPTLHRPIRPRTHILHTIQPASQLRRWTHPGIRISWIQTRLLRHRILLHTTTRVTGLIPAILVRAGVLHPSRWTARIAARRPQCIMPRGQTMIVRALVVPQYRAASSTRCRRRSSSGTRRIGTRVPRQPLTLRAKET